MSLGSEPHAQVVTNSPIFASTGQPVVVNYETLKWQASHSLGTRIFGRVYSFANMVERSLNLRQCLFQVVSLAASC